MLSQKRSYFSNVLTSELTFTWMILLSRNEELNTRFKFDVERLNRQIERRASQSDTESTETVRQQVLIASGLFVQKLLEDTSTASSSFFALGWCVYLGYT